ncbi:MAG TPA: FAD-dependent oxidoreductase, partial [Flavobacterium sp.]|nr:FAD-dependent oxidoreductase [Flavobacterium sp.]
RLANVSEIDTVNQKITADIGELKYDYLVIASGSKTNYFGNREIEKNSVAMKTIPQSLNIRSLILENFEQAVLATNIHDRHSLMNFVLVGGGPTGVELAGALAEMKKVILPKDYPDLDVRKMEINLVQGEDRILNTMSEKSSRAAEEFLIKLGVNIWKNVRVTGYDGKTVTTNTDLTFESATVVWTAGVCGALPAGIPENAIIQGANRLSVNEFNQVQGFENIFAIGDVASMSSKDWPKGHPMMAQPAMQQGDWLAKNLIKLKKGKKLKPFSYNDKGSMATVGRNKAVVDLPKFHFNGFFAWFVWIFVHLFSLIGFKNKAVVFLNWVYNYVRLDREGRLIIRPFKRKDVYSFENTSES